MGAASVYLMLSGGFVVSAGNALARKDAVHMFLFAFLALAAAMLAGSGGAILAWACVVYVLAMTMFAVRAIVRACTGADGFNQTLLATVLLSLVAIGGEAPSGPMALRPYRPSVLAKSLYRSASRVARDLDRPPVQS